MTSPLRLGITSQASRGSDLPNPRPTRLPQVNQRLGSSTFLRHPIASRLYVGRFVHPKVNSHLATKNWLGLLVVVPEYQPVVHRLRLSASP